MTSEKPNPNQQLNPESEVKTPVSAQSAGEIPAPAPEHPEQQDAPLSPEVGSGVNGEAAVAEKTEDVAVTGSTDTSSSPDSTTDTTKEKPDQASAATQSATQDAAQAVYRPSTDDGC